MSRDAVPADNYFEPFEISTHTYKVVDGHSILADVYIPKRLLASGPDSAEWKKKRPLMIRIHGGWLIGGQRNHFRWSPRWMVSLAHSVNAIIVAPDYRLLPEATVTDTLDDMDTFWTWFNKELPTAVREHSKSKTGSSIGLEVDLNRVVVEGESAGGYLAIQFALSHFEPRRPHSAEESQTTESTIAQIRALVAIYPMLDFHSKHWTEAYPKSIFEHPQVPASVIDDYLASIAPSPTKAKQIISNAPMEGLPRSTLAIAYIQHGRILELLGPERDSDSSPGKPQQRIHPEERLADGAKLPPTLFVHGIQDTGVPVEGTDKFIGLIREHNSIIRQDENTDSKEWDSLMYARVSGDHGFESALGPEDAVWVKEGLDYVEKLWLA